MRFALDSITTVIINVLCILMLYKKYDLRRDHIIIRIAVLVLINAVKLGTVILAIPLLNFLTSCIVDFAIVRLIYKCSIKTTIIYSGIFVMISFVADVLGVIIVSVYNDITISQMVSIAGSEYFHYIWNWIFMIFISRIFHLFITPQNNMKVRWHEVVFYILLIIFETLFFFIVLHSVQEHMSGQFFIFVMTGFLVLDICVVYILRRISLLRDAEQKLHLMQQQENMQLQMYRELNIKYDSAREIAHDINRHINSLEALINTDHNEQAKQYFSDLSKAAERLEPVIKNQNPMLAIILNTVSDRCKKENIRLKLNVEDFSLGYISDIDITTIFSNLLDNAIEACMELPEQKRYISFVLKKQIGLIAVKITNPCEDMTHINKGHSTKKEHSGIGLMNVKKAVDKYEGVFSVKHSEKEFCVSITFNENRHISEK